jgi:hypothetical protein
MNENYNQLIIECRHCYSDRPFLEDDWKKLQNREWALMTFARQNQRILQAANRCGLVQYKFNDSWHLHPPMTEIVPTVRVRIAPDIPMPSLDEPEPDLNEDSPSHIVLRPNSYDKASRIWSYDEASWTCSDPESGHPVIFQLECKYIGNGRLHPPTIEIDPNVVIRVKPGAPLPQSERQGDKP